MARGRRSGRPGVPGGATPAAGDGVPDSYETVEFEELPEGSSSGGTRGPAGGAGAGADTGRIDAMAEPDETREPASAAAATGPDEPYREPAPPQALPRRGGFLPGLVGGLLGGAVVTGAGGWYAYEHGPIKPALGRLDATEAAARAAESGVATLGGKLDEVGTGVSGLGNDLGALKAALQQADQGLAGLTQRVATEEQATAEFATRIEQATADLAGKLDQADRAFRAAADQVTARLEAVNAKLVEVEQAQPADVVDKQTVADIAAKQAGIEEGQESVAAGLARLEQLVTQSLEAGNQQAAALRTVVDSTRGRLEEISAEQRDLLALKDAMARREEVDQQHTAALAEADQRVAGVRTDLEQRLGEVATRLTALDAERERGVGLSLAAHSLGTAMETGQPFRPTLDVLTQLGEGDPVISGVVGTLEPMAADGVPTFAVLARELGAVGRSLAPESQAAPDDWLTRTRENLTNLVDLHPVEEEAVPGENAVQGAQQALLLQDLPGAVAALKPLAEQGNEPAKAWVARAEQRLAAGASVETLRQHVKSVLTRQG
jgi:hypothetical protein